MKSLQKITKKTPVKKSPKKKSPVKRSTVKRSAAKKSPVKKVLNPATGRYVSATGAIGKSLLSKSAKKSKSSPRNYRKSAKNKLSKSRNESDSSSSRYMSTINAVAAGLKRMPIPNVCPQK